VVGVAAGQIRQIGQKIERVGVIGWRQVFSELTMSPTFGSMGGALRTYRAGRRGPARYWHDPVWIDSGTFGLIVSTIRKARG
jgi:hypothetical protein